MSKIREIIHYHEETKHHFHRFAKSLGYMDWKNQPNPFRFYENVKTISLPLLKETPKIECIDLHTRKNTVPQAFNFEKSLMGVGIVRVAGTFIRI